MALCASTSSIAHVLRGWTAVLLVSVAALVLLVPLLVRICYRSCGVQPPSRGKRFWVCLSATAAFAAALAFGVLLHKLLGLDLRGGAAQTLVWLISLVGAVVLAVVLMRRDLPPGPAAVGTALYIPATVAIFAIAGAFVAVGRLDDVTKRYFSTEVALRDLSAALEKHRAETGAYPRRLSQLRENPASGLYYLPLPDASDAERVRAWRMVDDPLGTAAAVLTCSGEVRWLSVRQFSQELGKSTLAAVEHTPPRQAPGITTQPARRPAIVPEQDTPQTKPATAPSTRPTQPAR